jgi:hypothetical protein
MRYFYPQYAPLAEISDPNGNTITLTRDSSLNLTQITPEWQMPPYAPRDDSNAEGEHG